MTALIIIIIILYVSILFILGYIAKKRTTKDLEGVFLGNRQVGWFLLGTSMVATTYAPDTPLSVVGLIRTYGISGNWYWWSFILSYVAIAYIFARWWRRSGVITDVELTVIRYGNTPLAKFLRLSKAIYLGFILNVLILGWVFLGMAKVLSVSVPFDAFKNFSIVFELSQKIIPDSFVIISKEISLLVLIALLIVLIYDLIGGLMAVMLTDLIQFSIVIVTSILIGVYAIKECGGILQIKSSLSDIYSGSDVLNFLPGGKGFPLDAFMIMITVGWWAHYNSDGTGYFAQRINAAKSEKDSMLGVFLFTFLHFCLRTLPWLMVGIASLVLFPLDNPGAKYQEGAVLLKDPEIAFPLTVKIIGSDLLIFLFLFSMVAAFMSTVDTHLNWGASYIVNDLLLPLFNIKKRYVFIISKVVVVLLGVSAFLISTRINSIYKAWIIASALGGGLGISQILRWIWWRTNPYTEISAMLASLASTVLFIFLNPSLHPTYAILVSGMFSLLVAISVTLITKPVDNDVLWAFYEKVKPVGLWKQKESTLLKKWFICFLLSLLFVCILFVEVKIFS